METVSIYLFTYQFFEVVGLLSYNYPIREILQGEALNAVAKVESFAQAAYMPERKFLFD